MKRIGVNVRLEVIQKTALLGTAKILRKVLSLYERRKRGTWDPWWLVVTRSQGPEGLLTRPNILPESTRNGHIIIIKLIIIPRLKKRAKASAEQQEEVVLVMIVIGALGTVSKRFHLYLKKAGLDGSILSLQKACLLETARNIRKVMDT